MDALPTLVANTSHDGNSSEHRLPDGLLDTLSPLLGFQLSPLMKLFTLLHEIIGSHHGIDLTYILILVGFFWAMNKVGEQLYTTYHAVSRQHFTASIEVSSGDDIHGHIMKFLTTLPEMVNSRFLAAETASKVAWDKEDDSDLATVRVSPDGYLNFSNQPANAAPRFIPAPGLHSFRFSGRYFMLQRKQDTSVNPGGSARGKLQDKDKETLVLSCFGRSPEPIKQLLQHAKEQYYLGHQTKTTVRRPSNRGRIYGESYSWRKAAVRPIRPMRTVVLDNKQKDDILSDMNSYLHPDTPSWYSDRGIPYRRGYLFYGPPGTGKTSLSFALAGVFGLDIYVISLLDPMLTEVDLLALFTSLPLRCVVLLEDIDTAGLKRPEDTPAGAASLSSSDNDEKKKGISLSGLLNAIDGVASHEGRVLIMTTNKPEDLDTALLRPGRIDLRVEFTNATTHQARELFMRMYAPESRQFLSGATKADDKAGPPTSAELSKIAEGFSSKIPSGEFSPAELQGFLLKYKEAPRNALSKVEIWVQNAMGKKASKIE
jgi:chaperone BCS1